MCKAKQPQRFCQSVIHPVERVVNRERILKDRLYLAPEGTASPTTKPDDILAAKADSPVLAGTKPNSSDASVVLPLPLSPAIARIGALSWSILSAQHPAGIATPFDLIATIRSAKMQNGSG